MSGTLRWQIVQELMDDNRACYARAFQTADGSWEVWSRTAGLLGVYTDLELARQDLIESITPVGKRRLREKVPNL